ncbi:alpha/beta hydrolase [Nevskia ramosa]|uniref:alpha/beta hydrolase n=1 Tax=Nevskia ramosa TaxID=64002 RepID=UPI002357AC5F|nr:alpha/beta hydrolase [Nevskia ramosa]
MPLNPQVQGFLGTLAAAGAQPFHTMEPAQARQAINMLMQMMPPSALQIAGVRDTHIAGPAGELKLRIYTPNGKGPFPILMYFHGGGFVIGDLDTFDSLCRETCAGAGVVMVSVDYRLAPEHAFPAASDDCLAATRWAAAHAVEINGDAGRLGVSGDSAGGNLAAVTALRLRDEGGPALKAQLLVYPVVDADPDAYPSMTENAEGYLLGRKDMEWFFGHYVKDPAALTSISLRPIKAESLKGLPPALVITAEFDPLRDEGNAYAAKLKAAGVAVESKSYDGAIHGFYTFFSGLDVGRQAVDQGIAWLKKTLVA